MGVETGGKGGRIPRIFLEKMFRLQAHWDKVEIVYESRCGT